MLHLAVSKENGFFLDRSHEARRGYRCRTIKYSQISQTTKNYTVSDIDTYTGQRTVGRGIAIKNPNSESYTILSLTPNRDAQITILALDKDDNNGYQMQHLCRLSTGQQFITILSRKNTMDIKIRDKLRKILKEKYYFKDDLIVISHDNCEDDDNKDKKNDESRRERGDHDDSDDDDDDDDRRRRRSGTMTEQRENGTVVTGTSI